VFGEEAYARFVEADGITTVGVAFAVGVTAAILIPSLKPIFSFFGGGPGARRIRKHGRPARAVIQSIGESSMGGTTAVNDQPYPGLTLEVDDGSRPPYLVNLDTIIPRAVVPQFQPGAVIPVKVDAEDPQKVVDWSGARAAT
jgi:hypothetical protein